MSGGRPANTPEVFWSRCEPEPNTGCWLWTGRRNKADASYGRVNYRGRRVLAHRLAYELAVGPIPTGLTLDHRCRQQACINPDHLRPMTLRENQQLGGQYIKTHCPRGHLLDAVTHRSDGRPFRYCLTCEKARISRRRDERRRRRHEAGGLTFSRPEGA